MVSLVEQGWADQSEVAGHSVIPRARCGGISGGLKTAAAALDHGSGYPKVAAD
jgi:hypothetical protein